MEPALAASRIVRFGGHALESIGRARLEIMDEAPLLRMRKRGSCRTKSRGSANRQDTVNHHRSCIVPKPHRTVNGS